MVLPLVLLCSIDQHDKHFGFKILYSTWIRKNFLLVLHPEEAPALGNVHTILTIPHRFFQVKLFPDPCMCALWRALPSGLSRVCSPLQTWLAATAEKALSEWKVTLWHCDIGGFFFFGLSVWKVFFPSWQMRYVESITKTPLRPTKQTKPTVHALHRAHSKLYRCTAHH